MKNLFGIQQAWPTVALTILFVVILVVTRREQVTAETRTMLEDYTNLVRMVYQTDEPATVIHQIREAR